MAVKPENGNQGKGVSVNLHTEAEVRAVYTLDRAYDGNVLVERAIRGNDYRLLVVNGKLVAAARRDPAQVVGDGQHTVTELVELATQDPQRREGYSGTLSCIHLDDAADLVLAQQDLTRATIPADGEIVRLRQNGNLSTGGTLRLSLRYVSGHYLGCPKYPLSQQKMALSVTFPVQKARFIGRR
ncbi:MAG: hypothetical protein H0X24_03505 [Ktedonobacterales bacterium]|nr:hypothetical protein [Ktedonobacterales bacterium]